MSDEGRATSDSVPEGELAEVIDLDLARRRAAAGRPPERDGPAIDDVLAAFLSDQRERLADSTYRRYESIVDLLRMCLNNYGYQSLHGDADRRWREAYEAGDEEAFTRLLGPEWILDNYGEFLGYFMVRKVAASNEDLKAAGTVTKRLARWLRDNGHVTDGAADNAYERARDARRDLPRAEQLSAQLFELARSTDLPVHPNDIPDEDWIEDHLPITRVEPGRLWFGDVGPVAVPRDASDTAEVGWDVNVVLARLGGQWRLVETGSVYP